MRSPVIYPVLPERLSPLVEESIVPVVASQKYKKKGIPKALKEQVWLAHVGAHFSSKCKTPWCKNGITVFDYHTSHLVPESLGGPTVLDNLIPLCAKCNLSMGTMTYSDWCKIGHRDDSIRGNISSNNTRKKGSFWLRLLLCCCDETN
jgi:5-methylcytosine-specific restriction endonuclease McrA